MTVVIAGHLLLSERAKKLDANTQLVEHTSWAAELLGLQDLEVDTVDVPRLRRILVQQVNHQLTLEPDIESLKARTRGSRRDEYVTNPWVSLSALAAAEVLLSEYAEQSGETFDVVPSKR